MNFLPCMHIFVIKPSGPKALLFSLGNRQQYGSDYDQTYSPVVKTTSICILLATVSTFNLELHQMDALIAFLHGDLDRDVFMMVPLGLRDPTNTHLVCKLRKDVYGLKQASRLWYHKMHEFLVNDLGFVSSPADPFLYVLHKSSSVIIISLYGDYLLITATFLSEITSSTLALSKRFAMNDLCEAHTFLGLEILRDRQHGTLHLSKTRYITHILTKLRMTGSKSAHTPIDSGLPTSPPPTDTLSPPLAVPYLQAIGSLLHLMTRTRPYIEFSVVRLARYQENPTAALWTAVKRIFHYMSTTCTIGITCTPSNSSPLHGYSDSDWAGCPATRRSTSGYLFMLSGGAVSWRSKQQSLVAAFSCEAE